MEEVCFEWLYAASLFNFTLWERHDAFSQTGLAPGYISWSPRHLGNAARTEAKEKPKGQLSYLPFSIDGTSSRLQRKDHEILVRNRTCHFFSNLCG